MAHPKVPFSLLLTCTAGLTAPVALALLVLVEMDELRIVPALLAGLAVALALALLARLYLSDLLALRNYASGLANRTAIEAPSRRLLKVTDEIVTLLDRLSWTGMKRSERFETLFANTEAVLDRLPDPLVLLNGKRRILRSNQAAREHLGAVEAGGDLATLVRDPKVLEAVDAVLAARPPATAGGREVEFTLSAPVERIFIARIEPLAPGMADGGRAFIVFHDVTGARRLERMRADFVANASHELRTPLASLLGFIETLSGAAQSDREARTRFLQVMREQALRMRRLIEDLLSLSRIELDEHQAPRGQVETGEVLRKVADLLDLAAREKGMHIRLTLDQPLPAVTGDRDEIFQLFQNLIDNAVKYGAENTEIEVTARGDKAAVAVAVADYGPGIPRQHLPRLTERFYRVDNARSRALGGTGLGLAIVKHIVARHRGTLAIDSTEGKGSTFTVRLPTAD
jgi:two-component system phosphate regulon sensor histidine kinase PhoR